MDQARDDLRWLGLDWDEDLPRPTRRRTRYHAIVDRLSRLGRTFPCGCTRRDVERANVGANADGSVVHPPRCNVAPEIMAGPLKLRAHVAGEVDIVDLAGRATRYSVADLGPFVVRDADGEFTYQLTSTIDDLDDGITHVVRGNDLLDSTIRQVFLRNAVRPDDPPIRFEHLPLVVGPDGRKLAKRHGDTRLAELRDRGWSAERVLGLLASWSGLPDLADGATRDDWLEGFRLDRLPREAVVFDPRTIGLPTAGAA